VRAVCLGVVLDLGVTGLDGRHIRAVGTEHRYDCQACRRSATGHALHTVAAMGTGEDWRVPSKKS